MADSVKLFAGEPIRWKELTLMGAAVTAAFSMVGAAVTYFVMPMVLERTTEHADRVIERRLEIQEKHYEARFRALEGRFALLATREGLSAVNGRLDRIESEVRDFRRQPPK